MSNIKTKLNEHQRNIARILLETLLKEPGLSLTYDDIAQKSGIGNGAISVGKSIGKISELCYELGLPLLSVKVYSKEKGTPAEGFYELYKKLTGNPLHYSQQEAVRIEIGKIMECEHWQILSDYLGLGLDMSSFNKNKPVYAGDVSDPNYPEGGKKQITVNQYERNIAARNKCLEIYGHKCKICGFDFGKVYGSAFRTKIHVHHIVPISQMNNAYNVNPETDLIPVCPNCHTIIHSKGNNETYSIEQVQEFIKIQNN